MEHFHSEQQGCEIIVKYKKKFGVVYLNYVKCKTHHKMICKCGWEWHFHGGEDSRKICPKGKQDLIKTFDTVL